MADTVLTELKIHEFDTVAQFLQHESEVGENDLALTPFMPANLYLFYHHWADHIVNDPSWLRADTFSWQSGDVYQSAYKHLVADAKTAYAWISGSELFYTSKETVAVGDEVYVSTTKDSSTIDSVGSNTITFAHPRKDGVYTATRSTANDRLALGLMPFMQSENIDGTTIEFIVADDGHKICAPDQESNLIALYEATGSAWFYVLDTGNKQFKLPRELPLYADHAPIYGNTARQGDGNGAKGAPLLASTDNVSGSKGITTGGSSGTAGVEYYVGFQQIENAYADVGALRVASDGSQKHLYFYVGHFEQDELEKNAGISTELFNGKTDVDLGNVPSAGRATAVGWNIPDYSAGVGIASGFVADKAGIVIGCMDTYVTNTYIRAYVNGELVAIDGGSNNCSGHFIVPIDVGDTVTFDGGYKTVKFYPFKGVI